MQFNQQINADAHQIEQIFSSSLIIDGQEYSLPICLHETVFSSPIKRLSELTLSDFQAAKNAGAEIVLIGTGEKQQFLDATLLVSGGQMGLGVECMTTAAACRTYALLSGEKRTVWAWLF